MTMISKKDLLKEVNISYGQLYRWKREGLIPDEWFIKQAVSTGQETFFKRELIIPRIQKIIELKDHYQLDELIGFFSPTNNIRKYTLREVIIVDDLDPYILKNYTRKKDYFSLIDLIIIYIFSKHQDIIPYERYQEYDFSVIDNINVVFFIIKCKDEYNIVIGDEKILFDKDLEIYEKIRFEDVASIIAKNV